jgi:hypothetical protein
VEDLQQATLDNLALGLSDHALDRLRNPPHTPPRDAVDKIALMAIDLYMINPSEETYESHRTFVLKLKLASGSTTSVSNGETGPA